MTKWAGEDGLLICFLTKIKWKAGTEIVLHSLFATASQPRADRPFANECNNYSSPWCLSTWANRGTGPPHPPVWISSKEEDPGFLGNGILACVDSYSECLFTMYSIYIYMHIYIQNVFLLQCLLSIKQCFGIPTAPFFPSSWTVLCLIATWTV